MHCESFSDSIIVSGHVEHYQHSMILKSLILNTLIQYQVKCGQSDAIDSVIWQSIAFKLYGVFTESDTCM